MTIPLAISSLALASMSHTMAHSPFLAFMSLLAATLAWAPNGIMYSYPATFLQGPAAATGVALINSIANIGGMIGPYLIGGLAWLYMARLCVQHSCFNFASRHQLFCSSEWHLGLQFNGDTHHCVYPYRTEIWL